MTNFYRILSIQSAIGAFLAFYLFAVFVQSEDLVKAFMYLLLMYAFCGLFINNYLLIQQDEKRY